MTHSTHTPVYSWQFAHDVVWNFLESYSRVTIFFAKKLGIEPKEYTNQLIEIFRYKNVRWRILREVMKYVQKHGLMDELSRYSRKDFIKYLTSVRWEVEDLYLDELERQNAIDNENFID